MYISSVDSTSFGRLYRGNTIKKEIMEKGDKEFVAEVNKISKAIRKENLHKSENVDIILQHNDKGFYGVIKGKHNGVPVHPANQQPVSLNNDSMKKFTNWAKIWDSIYSISSGK